MSLPMVPTMALALAALAPAPVAPERIVPVEGRVHLEWNPGEGEVLVQFSVESETDLERVQIVHPGGRQIADLDTRRSSRRGLTSLEFELREPDMDAVRSNFAEGRYSVRASTVGRTMAFGVADLSFDLPDLPRVSHPRPGAVVPSDRLTVTWVPQRDAAGYELQLEQGENDGLRVKLPPTTSSFQVPDGFLARGTETYLEVAAIGANGNRTVVDVVFATQP